MAGRIKKLALNTFSNYLKMIISMLIMLWLTPVIIRGVGSEQFGLWSLILSILGFFGLMDFGLASSVVKYTAECNGRGDVSRRNVILSTITVTYVMLAVLAVIGIGILILGFNTIFTIPLQLQTPAIACLVILSFRFVILGMPLSIFRGVLFAQQHVITINAIELLSLIVYGGMTWGILKYHGDIVSLAWANLAAMLLEYTGYILMTRRVVEGLRLSFRLADWSILREIISFSSFALLTNVAALILLRTDPLIVKLFLPLASVAIYAVALKIGEYALLLTKQFINLLGPIVAEMSGKNEIDRIRDMIIKGTKYALVPTMLLCVTAMVFSREGIEHWVGADFATGASVLVILLLSNIVSIPQMVASNVLSMTGWHRFTGKAAILSAIINVAASVILIRFLGLNGVALGTLIATILIDIFMIIRKVCQSYSIRIGTYLRQAIAPALIPGILIPISGLLLKRFYPPTSLFIIVLEAIPGVVLYLLLFYWFSVTPEEKQRIKIDVLRLGSLERGRS